MRISPLAEYFGSLEATLGATLEDTSEGFFADGGVSEFSTPEAVEDEWSDETEISSDHSLEFLANH